MKRGLSIFGVLLLSCSPVGRLVSNSQQEAIGEMLGAAVAYIRAEYVWGGPAAFDPKEAARRSSGDDCIEM